MNELPFDQIYGETGANFRLASACAALLALCLTIPGVFWLERRYGMELVLLSTPTGRNTLWRWKVILVLCVSAVIWLAWSWHELFLFQRPVVLGTSAYPMQPVCTIGTPAWGVVHYWHIC